MVKSSLAAALSIIMAVATFCRAQEIKCPIQSIYQFGDSLFDPGNTINLSISAAARPPYDTTFPGYPTVRFSDGRLIIDYIDCADKLSKSLVFVGEIGYNDISVSLILARPPRPHEEILPLVVEAIINTTQEVIKNGASQVIVPGVIPVGCSPLTLGILSSNDSTRYDDVGCLKSANDLTTVLNDQLQEALVLSGRNFLTLSYFMQTTIKLFSHFSAKHPILGLVQKLC